MKIRPARHMAATVARRRLADELMALPGRGRPAPTDPLALLGSGVRHGAAWLGMTLPGPARPVDDRALACAVMLGGLASVASPVVGVLVAVGAVVVPRRRAAAKARRHQEQVEAELPLVVDLLAVAAQAGNGIQQSLAAVAQRAVGPVGAAMRGLALHLRSGWLLADALEGLEAELGEPVRPLTAVLLAASRDGDPLVPALLRLSDELHDRSRRRAEAAARRLSVRLLLPLVLCTLPAFALLTLGPLAVASLHTLPRSP